MLTQADFMSEGFVAQLAGIGAFSVVRSSSMHLKSMRRAEHLLASNEKLREGRLL